MSKSVVLALSWPPFGAAICSESAFWSLPRLLLKVSRGALKMLQLLSLLPRGREARYCVFEASLLMAAVLVCAATRGAPCVGLSASIELIFCVRAMVVACASEHMRRLCLLSAGWCARVAAVGLKCTGGPLSRVCFPPTSHIVSCELPEPSRVCFPPTRHAAEHASGCCSCCKCRRVRRTVVVHVIC